MLEEIKDNFNSYWKAIENSDTDKEIVNKYLNENNENNVRKKKLAADVEEVRQMNIKLEETLSQLNANEARSAEIDASVLKLSNRFNNLGDMTSLIRVDQIDNEIMLQTERQLDFIRNNVIHLPIAFGKAVTVNSQFQTSYRNAKIIDFEENTFISKFTDEIISVSEPISIRFNIKPTSFAYFDVVVTKRVDNKIFKTTLSNERAKSSNVVGIFCFDKSDKFTLSFEAPDGYKELEDKLNIEAQFTPLLQFKQF